MTHSTPVRDGRRAEGLALGSAGELALRGLLKNHHRGEGAAVPKPRLLALLAAMNVRLDRRDLDETLRTERAAGFPVTATEAGVFWAVRREELAKARHYVAARFADLRETVEAYDRILEVWAAPPQVPGRPPAGRGGQGLLFGSVVEGSRT